MHILIDDERKISSIKREFNNLFPYLKLEFFNKLHRTGGSSAKKQIKESSATIGECRKKHNEGTLIITPLMTVADLEQAFGQLYGLSVQVFRKSGKVWLETTVTDNWSLDLQNKQGESLSNRSRLNHSASENEAAE